MVALAPESATPMFEPVVVRGELTFEVTHEGADRGRTADLQEQAGMVGGKAIIQRSDLESLRRPLKSAPVLDADRVESKKEAAVVALMGEVVDMLGQENARGSRH